MSTKKMYMVRMIYRTQLLPLNHLSYSCLISTGNTPLHLAVMLGRMDCLKVLLEKGAKIAVKNGQGWTPLAEAVSYGNRDISESSFFNSDVSVLTSFMFLSFVMISLTVTTLLKNQKQQTRDELSKRRPELIKGLESMGNFYMELRWDFQSWIPLVSRILPSDVCKIYKKGANIRVDTTLVDFNDMKWERGDVSFLFRGKGCSTRHGRHRNESSGENGTPSYALIVMDNKLRVFQRVKHQEREQEVEDEVDILMSNDIVSAQINTKHLNFDRVSTGWLFKSDKTETVGSFLADFYAIQGFVVESRKRREHLTDEDLQKNRAIMESLTKGPEVMNGNSLATQSPDNSNLSLPPISMIPRRTSLPPPPLVVSWSEYISSPPGQFPVLGRHPICKVSSKTFKATLAMSQDFPMTVDALINLLEVIAPFKQFKKMREFVEMKLPPGFPVKIGQFNLNYFIY